MKQIAILVVMFIASQGFAQNFGGNNDRIDLTGFENKVNPKPTVAIEVRLKPYVDQFIADAKKYMKKDLTSKLLALDSIKIEPISTTSMGVTRKKRGSAKVIVIQPFADSHMLKSTTYHELVHALFGIDDHFNDTRGSLINEYATTDWEWEKANWDALVKKLFVVDIPILKKIKKINKKRRRKGLAPATTLEEAEEWLKNR